MKGVKYLGLGIVGFLGIIILATVVGLGAIVAFFALQLLLSGDKGYLLFVSDNKNIIPVILLEFTVVYLFYWIKERFNKKSGKKSTLFEDRKIIKMFAKSPKVIKSIFGVILIIALYCGMTSYTVLYDNSIKVSTPFSPSGVTYRYSDVKTIEVGIRRINLRNFTPYYKIKFYNNKTAELFNGSGMDEQKGKTFENILIDFDEELRNQGVAKSVNKQNFEKYSKSLDKEFISRVEKLFEN